ncbi:MAG: SirB2 family protein [Burkholderiaceae bacterium]
MDYATVRWLHVACVGISVGLFAMRGAMQLGGVDWRRWRWLRITPHLNDTVLLGAGVTLALMSAQYPFAQNWLTAKVLALCAYVALGRVALTREVSPRRRRVAFAASLLSVGYIVAVALTRSASLGLSVS